MLKSNGFTMFMVLIVLVGTSCTPHGPVVLQSPHMPATSEAVAHECQQVRSMSHSALRSYAWEMRGRPNAIYAQWELLMRSSNRNSGKTSLSDFIDSVRASTGVQLPHPWVQCVNSMQWVDGRWPGFPFVEELSLHSSGATIVEAQEQPDRFLVEHPTLPAGKLVIKKWTLKVWDILLIQGGHCIYLIPVSWPPVSYFVYAADGGDEARPVGRPLAGSMRPGYYGGGFHFVFPVLDGDRLYLFGLTSTLINIDVLDVGKESLLWHFSTVCFDTE